MCCKKGIEQTHHCYSNKCPQNTNHHDQGTTTTAKLQQITVEPTPGDRLSKVYSFNNNKNMNTQQNKKHN